MVKISPDFVDKKIYNIQLFTVSNKISCTQELLGSRFNKLFNTNNMSALDNYAQKEKVRIYFSHMNNELSDKTMMYVLCKSQMYKQALKLSTDTKEDFVNSMRAIYDLAAKAVKLLKNK